MLEEKHWTLCADQVTVGAPGCPCVFPCIYKIGTKREEGMWKKSLASVQRRGIYLPGFYSVSYQYLLSDSLFTTFYPILCRKSICFPAPLLLKKCAFLTVVVVSALNSELWLQNFHF